MRRWMPVRSESRGYQSISMGSPTEMFDRIVESNEISTHFAASAIDVEPVTTRSITGLPYLLSPTWKYRLSGVASMKLPCV